MGPRPKPIPVLEGVCSKGSFEQDLLLGLNFVSKISCFHLNGVGNSNSMLLRPPFDTLLRFNRCPLPLTAFLSTNEQKAEPSRSKPSRSKPDARGQKWKKGFQERCKALGHVPRLDLYVCFQFGSSEVDPLD